MSRFVRQSKFRHVFGTPAKAEHSYDNISLTGTAWDTNYMACSNLFFAILWRTAGGGSIMVNPYDRKGRLPVGDRLPVISGHKSAVLDIEFSPFNDSLLASVSEDCYGKLWQIPEGGVTETMTEPVQLFRGHKRKVGTVNFNPTAENVVATSSQDYTVKLWDVETGNVKLSLDGPSDLIQSLSWSSLGDQLAITCKDKKVRVGDPRTEAWAAEWDGHKGVKGSRCLWFNDGKVFTVGFGRTSDREYSIWDPRDTSKPLVKSGIDTSSGILMPFYDADTSLLFLAGKGDGNIRYYEYTGADKLIYFLAEYKSRDPCKGGALKPKTACNVSNNEICCFMKLEKTKCTPISFQVPRKSDLFQDDLFPETCDGAGIPGTSAAEWFAGENKPAGTVSLEKQFVAKPKVAQVKKVEEKKKLTPLEMEKALAEAQTRVAYLEAELKKRDLKIKELEGN